MGLKEELTRDFFEAVPFPKDAPVDKLVDTLEQKVLIPLAAAATRTGYANIADTCYCLLDEISLWRNNDPTVSDNDIRNLCLFAVGEKPG